MDVSPNNKGSWKVRLVSIWTLCALGLASAVGLSAQEPEEKPPATLKPRGMTGGEAQSDGVSSHLGCAINGSCGGSCPFQKPQPTWVENRAEVASQFLDWARPQSLIRLHYDKAYNLEHPDLATYFWGKGGIIFHTKHATREESVDLHDLSFYMENASSKKASAFFEIPLRGVEPDIKSDREGLGDISLGTKGVVYEKPDCLLTFQFKTYLPTGAERHGNGTGHVALEPALLTSWRLCPDWYLQGELGVWIPIGGDKQLEGQVLKYGVSFNYMLWEDPCNHRAFIPTFELVGWHPMWAEFFSLVDDKNHDASNSHIINVGPGFRFVMSEHCEFGFGANFNITSQQWYDSFFQFEFRWFF